MGDTGIASGFASTADPCDRGIGWTMTDNQPTDRPEAFPGGAAPDSGGSPLGDVYGAGGAAATPPTATPGSGSTTSTGSGSSSGSSGSGSSGTRETVKDEAKHVRESAMDAGRQVAGTAKDEAQNVAGEAKAQARQLVDQTMHEAREQAKGQQQRLAGGISTFGDDLRSMADGAESGLAAQVVSEVSDRAAAVGRWLEEREPADLLDELSSFARRRPATFIAIAGVAGLVVGRLARGIVSEAKEEREQRSTTSSTGASTGGYGASPAYGAGTGSTGGAHAIGQPPVTQWNAPTAANASPEMVDEPYGGSPVSGSGAGSAVPGGSTRGTTVDGGVPAQTGHSPSGTANPTRQGDGL